MLENVERAISRAKASGIPVIYIQHVAKQGIAPLFNVGTLGTEIYPRIRAAAPAAPTVVKEYADSFEKTNLEEILSKLGVPELLVCGMMTHNCVTHTAISKAAEKYDVTILPDCCTTISEIRHLIALHAVSIRVELVVSSEAI